MNTGVVFCGRVGSDARHDYTAMGAAVNVAARLMKAADTGQVLVADETRRLAPGRRWRRLDPVRVKGRAEPVAVFEPLAGVEGATPPAPPSDASRPLFGRAAELRRAGALLDRALRGEGRLLEIDGEAGIGKTRLKDAVVAQARAAGFAVHTGACLSFGTTTSYVVWRGVCRGLLGIDRRASAEAQLAAIARARRGRPRPRRARTAAGAGRRRRVRGDAADAIARPGRAQQIPARPRADLRARLLR